MLKSSQRPIRCTRLSQPEVNEPTISSRQPSAPARETDSTAALVESSESGHRCP